MKYEYTYFIITPGVDIGSFIRYSDGKKGNYFKFGDTHERSENGIRRGYTTHNPDIGIAAVLKNGLSQDNLGTKIKQAIMNDGYPPVEHTQEWFSVNKKQAWALYLAVQQVPRIITDQNYEVFKLAVLNALNTNA